MIIRDGIYPGGRKVITFANVLQHDVLETFGISSYDLDNLAQTLLDVYDYQQQKYKADDVFSLLSLVGMALLELGVITEIE